MLSQNTRRSIRDSGVADLEHQFEMIASGIEYARQQTRKGSPSQSLDNQDSQSQLSHVKYSLSPNILDF